MDMASSSRLTAADATPLMLLGDLRNTRDLARELARISRRELAIRLPNAETIDWMREATEAMVMIEISVDVPDLLARLRGQNGGWPSSGLPVDALVGRTVAEVERALILGTLAHCRGNRTSAAHMLGISVRTMRNKLRSFIEDGIAVSPAH
ncbi:helix-turn-helix domain-containing protein [Sphingobium boeckii]|uniref:DNA-binding NtrC family response regulator n=1 Tax=Sphingobium boeckii TaxID=1082345 RepID=A0A7W9AGJ1_9SPHN|nr:helix-turn-helix domain-containing protein [Sphingobium boeckii]MBB5685270.1 DNA-binding NtrC family response regulator [Sphingobium boeckii]